MTKYSRIHGVFRSLSRAREEVGQPVPFTKSHIIGREDKRMKNKIMRPDTKNNGSAAYLDPVKKRLEKVQAYLKRLALGKKPR